METGGRLINLKFISDAIRSELSSGKFWYTECPICSNLDNDFDLCRKAFWKPKADTEGVCRYYEEEN